MGKERRVKFRPMKVGGSVGNFMKGFHVCFGVSDRVGPFSPHREVVIQSIWSETCREMQTSGGIWGVREGEDKVLED